MISKYHVIKYCKDYTKIENYDKAITDSTQTWHCHHRLETHKYKDRSRTKWIKRDKFVDSSMLKLFGVYYDRPPEELIFMTYSEHTTLHSVGEANGFYGREHSDESKQKMSAAKLGRPGPHTGKHRGYWWNNGITNTMCDECPGEGWVKGMIKPNKRWWNNGSVNKLTVDCPGEGWKLGRLTPWAFKCH